MKSIINSCRLFVLCFCVLIFAFSSGCTTNIVVETGKTKTLSESLGESSPKEEPSHDYKAGTLFTFCSSDDNKIQFTTQYSEKVSSAMRLRLDGIGFYDATVNVRNSDDKTEFEVWVPENLNQESIEEIGDYLQATGEISFKDTDGNILINSGHIKEVKPTKINEEHVVEVKFTLEGRKAFAEATHANVGRALSIYVDDLIISSPMVSESIDSDSCIISGGFDKDTAKMLSEQINAGIYPVGLELVSVDHISE